MMDGTMGTCSLFDSVLINGVAGSDLGAVKGAATMVAAWGALGACVLFGAVVTTTGMTDPGMGAGEGTAPTTDACEPYAARRSSAVID